MPTAQPECAAGRVVFQIFLVIFVFSSLFATATSFTATPASVNFGNVTIGQSSGTVQVAIINNGTALTLTAISSTGPFPVSSPPALPMTWATGQTITMNVNFVPAVVGSIHGNLVVITTTTKGNSSFLVPLSGTALTTTPSAQISPVQVAFKAVIAGSSSPPQQVTILNTGPTTISVTAVKAPAPFLVTGFSSGQSLGAGQSTVVTAGFAPKTAGTFSGSLSVTYDTLPQGTAPLSGRGLPIVPFQISPLALAFGYQNVNIPNPGSKIVTVTNPSKVPYNLTSVTAPAPFAVSGVKFPIAVNPGQSVTIPVSFNPSGAGAYGASLTLITDTQGTLKIPLTGSGIISPCNATTGYCATTSNLLILPSPLPVLPSANGIFIDPDFGSRILRVTDSHTADNMNVCLSFVLSPPSCALRSWETPSGAESNTWNADSSKFYVMMNGNSRVAVYDFNAATLSATPDPVNDAGATSLINLGGSEPSWSHSNPNILYGFHAQFDHTLQQYDFSQQAYSKLLNLDTDCPGLNLAKNDTNATGMSNSFDDNRVVFRAGGQTQNDERFVGVWDRYKGCAWYDVKNDVAGGTWGIHCTGCLGYTAAQKAAITGSHNARISRDGKVLHIVVNGAPIGNLFWVLDATTPGAAFVQCVDCGGHTSFGYDHLADCCGFTGYYWRTHMALDPPDTIVNLAPRLDNDDQHISWNNARQGANLPFIADSYINLTTVLATSTITQPDQAEILGIATDGSNQIWRFAHNRSWCGDNTTCQFWWSPRGNVSQDGRYFMFTSNMEQSLGLDLGSPKQLLRTDVFVVELK